MSLYGFVPWTGTQALGLTDSYRISLKHDDPGIENLSFSFVAEVAKNSWMIKTAFTFPSSQIVIV